MAGRNKYNQISDAFISLRKSINVTEFFFFFLILCLSFFYRFFLLPFDLLSVPLFFSLPLWLYILTFGFSFIHLIEVCNFSHFSRFHYAFAETQSFYLPLSNDFNPFSGRLRPYFSFLFFYYLPFVQFLCRHFLSCILPFLFVIGFCLIIHRTMTREAEF